MMDHDAFVRTVAARGGFEGLDGAERAAEATLEVLGERLSAADVMGLAEDLPKPLARILRRASHGQDFELAELYRRVGEREGISLGVAVEHAGIVCRVLREAVGDGSRTRLETHLPEPLAALFTELPSFEPPPPHHHHPHEGRRPTLSTGRPGGVHPLSETHANRTQRGSVARASDPHADIKLSTSEGTSVERDRRTLATGAPGSARPVSEAD